MDDAPDSLGRRKLGFRCRLSSRCVFHSAGAGCAASSGAAGQNCARSGHAKSFFFGRQLAAKSSAVRRHETSSAVHCAAAWLPRFLELSPSSPLRAWRPPALLSSPGPCEDIAHECGQTSKPTQSHWKSAARPVFPLRGPARWLAIHAAVS